MLLQEIQEAESTVTASKNPSAIGYPINILELNCSKTLCNLLKKTVRKCCNNDYTRGDVLSVLPIVRIVSNYLHHAQGRP